MKLGHTEIRWIDGGIKMLEYFHVGKIVNTHGLTGEVRVISITDFPDERYKKGNILYIFPEGSKEGVKVTIKTHRKHKNFDLLSFEQFKNIHDVEKYKGSILKVSKDQLKQLDEGEFYYHELIGCKVYNEKDVLLGEVKEILSPGANDVWVVKRKEKGKDILIPYIPLVVKSVDVKAKKILIEEIEGLIE